MPKCASAPAAWLRRPSSTPTAAADNSAGSTRALLASYGCRQSMGAAGYCYQNAFAESAFASIKTEMPPEDELFASKPEARSAIFDYIETFFNRRRLHRALGYQSPENFLALHFTNRNHQLN